MAHEQSVLAPEGLTQSSDGSGRRRADTGHSAVRAGVRGSSRLPRESREKRVKNSVFGRAHQGEGPQEGWLPEEEAFEFLPLVSVPLAAKSPAHPGHPLPLLLVCSPFDAFHSRGAVEFWNMPKGLRHVPVKMTLLSSTESGTTRGVRAGTLWSLLPHTLNAWWPSSSKVMGYSPPTQHTVPTIGLTNGTRTKRAWLLLVVHSISDTLRAGNGLALLQALRETQSLPLEAQVWWEEQLCTTNGRMKQKGNTSPSYWGDSERTSQRRW